MDAPPPSLSLIATGPDTQRLLHRIKAGVCRDKIYMDVMMAMVPESLVGSSASRTHTQKTKGRCPRHIQRTAER